MSSLRSSATMAMAPKVQKDAATTRRYSSMPAPMCLGDLVRNPASADSHTMAKSTENAGT